MIETTEKSNGNRSSLIFKIVAGFLALLFVLFFVLMLVAYIGSSSKRYDADAIKNENEKLANDIKWFENNLTIMKRSNDEYTSIINSLKATIAKLINDSKALNDLKSTQQQQIDSLKLINLICWIGGGTTLAAGLGATGYGIYQTIKTSEIASQLAYAQDKYKHYLDYYLEAWPWQVEDYMINYFGDYVTWEPLYDSSKHGWNRAELVKRVTGIPFNMTTTLILTDKNWMIAGFLAKPWIADGSWVKDEMAFTMSVNRVDNAYMPYWNDSHLDYTARLNPKALIEFGKEEIIIFENQTGMATLGKTYISYDTGRDPPTFYAGENKFKVAWVGVFGHTRIDRLKNDFSKRNNPNSH